MDFRTERIQENIRPPSEEERRSAGERIRLLGRPRMAGTEEAGVIAGALRERFEAMGYRIRELPFSYSAFPARWGMPIVGGYLVVAAALAFSLILADFPLGALFTVLITAGLLTLAGLYANTLIDRLPWERLEGSNWIIEPRERKPRYLVAAHRDSKSQPVSIFLRVAGIIASLAGWLALLGIAVAGLLERPAVLALVLAAGLTAIAGAVPLGLSWVGNQSPGALDNASGLAVLLGLAERAEEGSDVGFLVTDAEEMGLVGARAVAGQLPPVVGIINIDGVDDAGPVHLVERFGFPPRGRAPHLAAALMSAATVLGLESRRRGVPLGVLVEHPAYVRAGTPSLTMMRGRAGSLWRIHRPDDEPARLRGEGVADVVAMVDGALRVLRSATETDRLPEPLLGRRRAPEDPTEYLPRNEPESSPLLGYRRGPGV